MHRLDGKLMLEDEVIGIHKNGQWLYLNEARAPFYIQKTKDLKTWMLLRAMDNRRGNAFLLKNALRMKDKSDLNTVLTVNAAKITDSYWFLPEGADLSFSQVQFQDDSYAELALHGCEDCFEQRPIRTPELTNTGSFEKCWKREAGRWVLHKEGNALEYFSELFVCALGRELGFLMADYHMAEDGTIASPAFTNPRVYLDPMTGLIFDDDYRVCFDIIKTLPAGRIDRSITRAQLAAQYLQILYLDALVCNPDRHTSNFGFLRDTRSGKIVSMSPNYDNNAALYASESRLDIHRYNDPMIIRFAEFLESTPQAAVLIQYVPIPTITAETIQRIVARLPRPAGIHLNGLVPYILNGQRLLQYIIHHVPGIPQRTRQAVAR